ncbi:MAG: universal stress protein, partial [Bacillota bacterium]
MFKNILVATDGSELSERAMRSAVELAKGLQAKLTAVTCTIPFDEAVIEPWVSPRH